METKNQINTVAGVATFVKTLNDKELWDGDYSTRNGYWVIHRGANHHVYKVKNATARTMVKHLNPESVLVRWEGTVNSAIKRAFRAMQRAGLATFAESTSSIILLLDNTYSVDIQEES